MQLSWLIFSVKWTWLRDTQVTNKIVFLGVPVRMFPEEMSILVGELSEDLSP